MQASIDCRRPRARLWNFFAALAALVFVSVPSFALAAPPPAAEPAAEEVVTNGFFTKQWWIDTAGGLVSNEVMDVGLKVLLALVMFFVGWVLAKLFSAGIYRLLRKTELDNKLAEKLGINLLLEDRETKPGDEDALERGISLVVFYLLMALVVVAVLDFAGLKQTAAPIEGLLNKVFEQVPVVGTAILILVVAYIAALVLRKLVIRTLGAVGFDKRMAKLDVHADADAAAKTADSDDSAGSDEDAKDKPRSFSETIGQVVFWLVMMLGLAGAFDKLQIDAISVPLTNVINTLMGLLPIVGIAVLIGLGGYVLSKIVRAVVTGALETLGFDKLVAKVKLDGMFGSSTPSKVVGWLAMALIIVQTVIASLDKVGLETLSHPMTDMMGQFWAMLPALAISALFIVIGVMAGRLLRTIVHKALVGVGFDRLMERIGFGQIAEREDDLGKPAGLVAFIVQVVVVLLAVVQGLENLALDTWAHYVDAFLRFAVTRAAVAVVLVGVAFMIGNYVRDLIEARQRGEHPPVAEGEDAPAGDPVWMAEFARYTVLVFGFTMAVHQLGVAEDFVLLSFALLFGGLCLAGALAFGLGSRELAGELVRERYRKTKQGPKPGSSGGAGGSLFVGGQLKPPTKPQP